MDAHPQNNWETVQYDARYDVYWVEAGGAKQALFFCPWCGERFPPSQRDRWFDELEALGIDPCIGPIPEDFQSSAWRGVPAALASVRRTGAIGAIEGRYIDFFDIPLDDGADE